MSTARYKNVFEEQLSDERLAELESDLKLRALELSDATQTEWVRKVMAAADKLSHSTTFSSQLFDKFNGARGKAPVVPTDAKVLLGMYASYMDQVLKEQYGAAMENGWNAVDEGVAEDYQQWLDEKFADGTFGKGSTRASQNTRDAFDSQAEVSVPAVISAVHNTYVCSLYVYTLVGGCRRAIQMVDDGEVDGLDFQANIVGTALKRWETENLKTVERDGSTVAFAPFPTPAFISRKYAQARRVFGRVASLHSVYQQFLKAEFQAIFKLFLMLTSGAEGMAVEALLKASGGAQFLSKRRRDTLTVDELEPLTKAARTL